MNRLALHFPTLQYPSKRIYFPPNLRGNGLHNFRVPIVKKTIILLTSLAFVFISTSSFSQDSKEENSITALQLALEKNPENPEILSDLGLMYLKNELYQEAIDPLEKSLIIRDSDSKTHFHLALAYGAVGRHPEKLKQLQATVRLDPNMAEANFKLALAYAANKRHQEASQYYKKTIQLDPDYQEAHYFLALSYFLTNRYKEALVSIQETIRLSPTNAEAHYALGQIYMKLGRFNKAIHPLQTAMRIQPQLPKNKSLNSAASYNPKNK